MGSFPAEMSVDQEDSPEVEVYKLDEVRESERVSLANAVAKAEDEGIVEADDAEDAPLKRHPDNDLNTPPVLFATLCMGVIFGLALLKGRVFVSYVVLSQMRFETWIMMKMFLAAVGTSCLGCAAAAKFFPDNFENAKNGFKGMETIPVGGLLGGIILGAGMAIAGACPGMVLIQVGAGVKHSGLVLAGAFAGAGVYGLTHPMIKGIQLAGPNLPFLFVPEYLGIEHSTGCIGMGIMCYLCVVVLELIVPWKDELTSLVGLNTPDCAFLACNAWYPGIAGLMVGGLQLPCILLTNNSLGCATSYVVLSGQWVRWTDVDTQKKYIHNYMSMDRWWQVFYVCGGIVGAVLGVALAEESPTAMMGLGEGAEARAFLGGVVMLYGARLAAGCTTGHGISGMGMLCSTSFLVVPGMFGGGLIAGYSLGYPASMETAVNALAN